MRKIDRFGKDARIRILDGNIKTDAIKIEKYDTEIARLQNALSDAVKGADAVNEILLKFFGKNDIRITVNGDEKYVLMRGNVVAKNLSEGEKTAISFAYFIAKLFENNNELSNTIVYIDDPVSSLDSNHLLNIHAFIKDIFYKFDPATIPKHQCLASQLFISTHNYEFFHLTWEWMSKMKKDQRESYLIQRTDNNGLICSDIIECPDSIRKYRSEYLFLFSQIASYIQTPSNDPQVMFNLGNMARRFVEGYFSFKHLNYSNIDVNIRELIPDRVKAERARKFMHFYSHTLTRGGGLKFPEMSEAKDILETILAAIRKQDPLHYAALEAAI